MILNVTAEFAERKLKVLSQIRHDLDREYTSEVNREKCVYEHDGFLFLIATREELDILLQEGRKYWYSIGENPVLVSGDYFYVYGVDDFEDD